MPPTQLGHLNNIWRTKYNIKRQIQFTMHMREEPNQKGVLYDAEMQGGMMTWAWYNDDATIIYMKVAYI